MALFLFCWTSSVFFTLLLASSDAASVGINYGRVANNLPNPAQAVELMKQQGITKVKLYDADSTVLAALAGTGIDVVVALPNEELVAMAASRIKAYQWVSANVSAHLPHTSITTIAVGNEVLSPSSSNLGARQSRSQIRRFRSLLPAMKNIHTALASLKLDGQVKVSTPHSSAILASSFPPSSGTFSANLANTFIKPILDFLNETGSYVMINAYPFFAYESDPKSISLDYALFRPNAGVLDSKNGLKYYNLLDAQMDAFYSAMATLGHNQLNLVVTETGWPSKGDSAEYGASKENAQAYISNLMKHVNSNVGTPLKPGVAMDTYIFALFNENMKPGPTSERNYGLFYPDEQRVYSLDLQTANPPTNSANVSNSRGHHHRKGRKQSSWCVANPSASLADLQVALDFACGEGNVDCGPIQVNAPCFDPDTLVSHASYAFNSYYKKALKAAGSCFFGGSSLMVSQDPSYTGCTYP